MKLLSVVILFVSAVVGRVCAQSGVAPTYTLLWNDFTSTIVINGVAVMGGRDGVMTARFDQPVRQFSPVSYSYVAGPIVRLKLADSILIAQSSAGSLYFFRAGALPSLELLGTAAPAVNYADFAVIGSSVILARGFAGVSQYTLDSYSLLTPTDSTLEPVHAIALETVNDRLFVVDDYTGIFAYRPGTNSLGPPASLLALTSPATAIAFQGDTGFLAIDPPAILRANIFADSLAVVDTLPAFFSLSRLMIADTFVVGEAANGTGFDLVSFSHRHNPILLDSSRDGAGAAAFSAASSSFLAVPDDDGGLQLYDLDRIETDLLQPRQSYTGAGKVQNVCAFAGSFVLAQTGRPLTAYSLDPSGAPQPPTAVIPGMIDASEVIGLNDRLVAFYPDQHLVAVIQSVAGQYQIDTALDQLSGLIHGVRMNETPLGTARLLFLLGDQFVDVYSVTTNWDMTLRMRMIFPDRPTDALLSDSTLLIGTANRVFCYVIRPDYSAEYRSTIELSPAPQLPEQLIRIVPAGVSGSILMVTSESIRDYDLSNQFVPTLIDSLAALFGYTDAALWGDHLWVTSTERGLLKVNIAAGTPIAIADSTPGTGRMVAVIDDIVVTANDHGAYLFDKRIPSWADGDGPSLPNTFALEQNYPNPFNPQTTIAFDTRATMRVRLEVFNVLGQLVGLVADDNLPPGHHTRVFDASSLSSGVYLYRVSAGEQQQTRKMMVLK